MAMIDIRGDIVGNDDAWVYEWFGYEYTCPQNVRDVITAAQPDETIEVLVNSGGGSVLAGQEIYSILRNNENTVSEIQSLAGSAAGVAAMGAHRVIIHPVAMVMIHNVSISGASGDHNDMAKYSEILKQMNEAMCAAYVAKSGRPLNEIMALMEEETWLTAEKALEYGFVDEIVGAGATDMTNNIFGLRITDEMRQQAITAKNKKEEAIINKLLGDLDDYGV